MESPAANPSANASALAAVLMQLSPRITRIFESLRFLVDQPVIRLPYQMGTAQPGGTIVLPGAVGMPLPAADFQHSLEWPFEVEQIQFSLDPAHSLRDFRVLVLDQTFNQPWMSQAVLADGLVDKQTGFWKLQAPWVVRAQGGALRFAIDNLDTINPLPLTVTVIGSLLIPR